MTDDTQFLDVDAISPKIRKVISINGKKHEYQVPKVKDFARDMTRVREIQKKYGNTKDLSEDVAAEIMIETLKEAVKVAFPTVTDSEIEELTFEQLSAIRRFIDAQVSEASKDAEDAQGNG